MRQRSRLAAIGQGLTATLVVFALLECGLRTAYWVRSRFVEVVPVPYRLGDGYGPTPPWTDRDRVLEPDDELLWRNRSGAHVSYADLFVPFPDEEARAALTRRFVPWPPSDAEQTRRWSIAIDSRGFREREFEERKTPGTFRVLCLGDSWTFGANVDQGKTYPRALEHRLRRAHPDLRVEVLNLGVLGYSSFQGRRLLESRALAFDPDLIVLGFGMNDGQVGGFRDKDVAAAGSSAVTRLGRIGESSELFKLLRYAALRVREHPRDGAEAFRAAAATTTPRSARDLGSFEPWTRVSLADYEANVRAMIALGRAGGTTVLLLDPEIDRGAYGERLEAIAADERVALVRADRLIAEARWRAERTLERRLGVRASTEPEPAEIGTSGPRKAAAAERVPVVLRAYAAETPIDHALYVVGEDPALGSLVPNRVALHDDGRDGDERAGDGVWSVRAMLPRGSVVRFALTNSGAAEHWEGLDVPAVRSVAVPASPDAEVVGRLQSFGALPLQSDAWHTDAEGLARIADAIARIVEREPAFVRFARPRDERPARRASLGPDGVSPRS